LATSSVELVLLCVPEDVSFHEVGKGDQVRYEIGTVCRISYPKNAPFVPQSYLNVHGSISKNPRKVIATAYDMVPGSLPEVMESREVVEDVKCGP
jgi:hypothetical protein